MRKDNFRFSVGEIIVTKSGEIEILELLRSEKENRKSYKYKCLKDGYIGVKGEPQIMNKSGCAVCTGQVVVKGTNDVATTHPELVKFFVNEEDCHKYSFGNKNKIYVKCDICGSIKKSTIVNLRRVGVCCKACSDGRSYSEKYTYELLNQLGVSFEHDIQFNWSNKKRYDFFLKDLNIIIETHGLQHYEKGFATVTGKGLEEEQDNDKFKIEIALKNINCEYIVLDCRKSTSNWIEKSIKESKLNEIFDLTNIDWDKCHEKGINTLVKDVCTSYMDGSSMKELTIKYKRDKTTIANYLKQGVKLGWCDYNPKTQSTRQNGKRVRVIETGDEYGSIKQLCEQSLVKYEVRFTRPSVFRVCDGLCKQHKGYTFEYIYT